MHAGGAIHSGMGGKAQRRVQVEIDINDFQARCTQLEEERQHVIQLIGARPLLDVFYEDLSSDTGTVVAGVCQMLGLESLPESITPALKKVGTEDLAQSVSNYDELLGHDLTRHWTQSR